MLETSKLCPSGERLVICRGCIKAGLGRQACDLFVFGQANSEKCLSRAPAGINNCLSSGNLRSHTRPLLRSGSSLQTYRAGCSGCWKKSSFLIIRRYIHQHLSYTVFTSFVHINKNNSPHQSHGHKVEQFTK